MKKTVIIILGALLVGILILQKMGTSQEMKIGILQTVSHPSLDAARDGFLAGVEAKNISVVIQNAEGSLSQARSIAQSFHADPSIQAIFAIATPAAQTLIAIEKKKPVFFAAVTDPEKAGIIQKNSCGATDLIDVAEVVELTNQLFPQAKKIAVPFNPSEANSCAMVQLLKKEILAKGLEPLEIGINQESEIAPAISKACMQADVLLLPTDNLLASALPAIVKATSKHQKAVISCFNSAIDQGALAARGVDYFESGKKVAEMAIDVLVNGKNPENIPLYYPRESKILLNDKKIAEIGLEIPQELKGGIQ
jgi:putative ABC transport system substrate-binding protein